MKFIVYPEQLLSIPETNASTTFANKYYFMDFILLNKTDGFYLA